MSAKTERFETLLTPEQRDLFLQAAALKGVSMPEYIVESAYEAAVKTVEEDGLIILSKRDQEFFIKSLLEDSEPNQRLQKAAKHNNEVMGSS